ncbi:MAG: cytochrome o ubiquinol oxidase subunit IV [Sphingobium sp.]|nr:MAG: cytochrome o ubiquinol oxidase subunit IV [Sphingobium sp.]
MSQDTHHGHHHHGDAEGHGSLKDYLIGFGLSVILTAIPFWLVMSGAFDAGTTAIVIVVFAVVQILVHMIYFLHMNGRSEGGWTMLALIFTIIVVAITMTGSMWVMYHLNTNMMPVHDMSQMP